MGSLVSVIASPRRLPATQTNVADASVSRPVSTVPATNANASAATIDAVTQRRSNASADTDSDADLVTGLLQLKLPGAGQGRESTVTSSYRGVLLPEDAALPKRKSLLGE